MKTKYTDINGINLRNWLVHGFLTEGDFSHINSFSVIYTIMVILGMNHT